MLLHSKSRKKCHINFENLLNNKDFTPKKWPEQDMQNFCKESENLQENNNFPSIFSTEYQICFRADLLTCFQIFKLFCTTVYDNPSS